MIGMLKGKVASAGESKIIILLTSGIGYEVTTPKSFTYKENEERTLYTYEHMYIEGSKINKSMFGFENRTQKEMFLLLTKAQGVGPKLAIETVGTFSTDELINILFTADITRLTQVSGMGKKKAEKLLFELKDKIEKMSVDIPAQANIKGADVISSSYGDSLKALVALGFSPNEATDALNHIENRSTLKTEELIREALILLGRK